MQQATPPQHEEIQMLAYHLWEQAGHPAGKSLDLWLEAEEKEMQKAQALWSLPAKAVRKAIHAAAAAPSQPKEAASPARLPAKGTVKAAGSGAEKAPPVAAAKKSAKAR